MIIVKEIIEIIELESVQENSSSNNRVLIHQDFESVAEQIVKKLTIHVVSQQRVLLIGLLTKLENGGGSAFIDKEQIVDDYLKAN